MSEDEPRSPKRRDFLNIAVGGSAAAFSVAVGYPAARFIQPRAHAGAGPTNVGKLEEIPLGGAKTVLFNERPVIVVGFEESGHGRGSVRGPKSARLHDALSRVGDALTRFGGHQAAAGVELHQARLADLRSAFELATSELSPESVDGDDTHTVWLDAADAPFRVLGDIMKLEPCGQANPAPRVAVEADLVAAREVKGGHLKLELELPGARRLGGFGVGMGARAAELRGRVVVLGRLRRDAWRGGDAVEMRVEEVHPYP